MKWFLILSGLFAMSSFAQTNADSVQPQANPAPTAALQVVNTANLQINNNERGQIVTPASTPNQDYIQYPPQQAQQLPPVHP